MKVFTLCCILLLTSAQAVGIESYNVDFDQTTVSGLSAGAFMAVQIHFAHSSVIKGSAIFAGGPFLCAEGTVEVATSSCMSTPWLISSAVLEGLTKDMAEAGAIDSLENLNGTKAFLYSGTDDTVVATGVVQAAASMYQHFGVEVQTEFDIDSEHCFPTVDFGDSCTHLGDPYINKCNYNGAQVAFNFLYGDDLNAADSTFNSDNLASFSQSDYTNVNGDISLNDIGYVYVPTACKQGTQCRLHIALHGCSQSLEDIGLDYVTKLGINEIAEANNIIVLYPQAKKSLIFPTNPYGCFDWWGYNSEVVPLGPSGVSYASKSGAQMEAIWNMAQQIAGLDWQTSDGDSDQN